MKKEVLFSTLSWDDLCEAQWYLFDGGERVDRASLIPFRGKGNVLFFHSLDDGPNWEFIKLFLKLKKKKECDFFICCDPQDIPEDIRKYHLFPDAVGTITMVADECHEVSHYLQKMVFSYRSKKKS